MAEPSTNTPRRNPFEILGVTPDAEPVVIRAAYRALAKMYHPDAQRGMTVEESTRRMAELNWAWEQLQGDLHGWRVRVMPAYARAPARERAPQRSRPSAQRSADDELDSSWKKFTGQYRRPTDEPLGWRAWIGSDVVCTECGCTLNTYVYKCPDCGQTDRWRRSTLHSIGHSLRFVYYAMLVVGSIPVALFGLGLLAVPVILVLDVAGIMDDDRGWPWEWDIEAQVLTGIGIAADVGVILGWNRIALALRRAVAQR
jgi:predicted RNA-binding Zn-ribbon protein involved in translation (DUF1610 family)